MAESFAEGDLAWQDKNKKNMALKGKLEEKINC